METQLTTATRITAADRVKGKAEAAGLQRKARPGETFIQFLLTACGVVSIFTTIGIVLVLGNESLQFFTNYGWQDSNHSLTTPITADQTTFEITASGFAIQPNMALRLDTEREVEVEGEMRDVVFSERMKVLNIEGTTLTVERGYEGTTAFEHTEDSVIFVGERPSIVEFVTNTKWQPQALEFGILPLVSATLITSFIALLVAVPVGLGAAIYVSEYASRRVRSYLKPILEILAGVPTVVYGYFALTFMTPLLRAIFGSNTVDVYNMLSAGLVMGIMIIPTISSMSEDALSSVPRSLREASYGLGSTRFETVVKVLLPAALSGILAAIILGISRAVGETMIVAIASGAGPNFTLNIFTGAETMTGHIARISTGDISYGSIDYNSLFAIGLSLFIITLILNLISNAINRRFREVYQ
jgi:phosphate transport system permease protein